MENGELIALRGQFQEAYTYNNRELWNGVKLTISVISSLLAINTGFILWKSDSDSTYAFFIIPVGIIVLLIFGYLNAKHYYEAVVQNISCVAKVEEELKSLLVRKQNIEEREYFKCDDKIIYPDWEEDRIKYKTSTEFVDKLSRFLGNPRHFKNTLVTVAWFYILLGLATISQIILFLVFD